MNFQEFIDSNSKKKASSEIAERWEVRVLPQGLHTQGEAGAQQYLNLYGKGIAAPKCIMFAVHASQMGYPDFSRGMWKKAFELTFGHTPEVGVSDVGKSGPYVPPAVEAKPKSDYFISSLQPGKVVTMQPTDAVYDRAHYIESDQYWGQPKRDGSKLLVFAAPDGVWFQTRTMRIVTAPFLELKEILQAYATENNKSFILEGELYYLDNNGKEHRTGAQAATSNINAGYGNIPPVLKYGIFYAIYVNGRDLRDETYAVRILHGNAIGFDLVRKSTLFHVVKTYRSTEEKIELAELQLAEGREGEVWFDAKAPYHAGKDKSEDTVRTKYHTAMDVVIRALTATTAQGRLFGAIEIADPVTGAPLGTIGTGFDYDDQVRIVAMHKANPGSVVIPMVCQGFTENGIAFLARLGENFRAKYAR